MIEGDTKSFSDYVTYPRTFEKYKWYKPLLTIVLVAIMYLILQSVLGYVFNAIYGQNVLSTIISGGYENINDSDASVYFTYLSLGILIPTLYIVSKIVSYRPFSSYSSSRGGWNWKIYFKCLTIPLTIYIIYTIIDLIINGAGYSPSPLSPIALIICLILVPFQCIAEEYIFRGLLMQTFGSWFRIPIVAIILQAILFAIGHTYDSLGVIAVGISGIVLGLLAWRTNGLEAGSAIHSINNLLSFYTVAFGLSSVSSTISMGEFVTDIIITVISGLLVYYIGTKREWFNEKTSKNKLF